MTTHDTAAALEAAIDAHKHDIIDHAALRAAIAEHAHTEAIGALDEFRRLLRADPDAAARAAIDEIERDIIDRRGIKREWRAIDDDVRAEIKAAWGAIVLGFFKATRAAEPARLTPDEARRLVDALRLAAAEVAATGRMHASGPDEESIRAEIDAEAALLRALGVES